MERKSPIKDVHKLIQKDLAELYKTLNNKLGSDNPFAKFSIGGGFYLWSDNRCQWRQMISAGDIEQSIVREIFFQTKTEIAAKLGEKTAEILFTTPDDSYIYFYDDNETIKILITGWGFKKPSRMTGTGDVDALSKKNPITLAFSYDGNRLQNYEFGIRLPRQVKRFKTDNVGLYRFANLKVGDRIVIEDLPTNKDFTLCVAEGQSHYEYDVTVYSTLSLIAESDHLPLVGERINIAYCGKDYCVETDANGLASISLPVHEGEFVAATLRDRTETDIIDAGGNEMRFSFEQSAAMSETDIEIVVVENGSPVIAADVEIVYAGHNYVGATNDAGVFTQRVSIAGIELCRVSATGFVPQSRALEDGKNIFRFEKTISTPSVSADIFAPYVRIEGDSGCAIGIYRILIEYDGLSTEYVSDENGVVMLPEMEAGKIMKVIDGLNPDNMLEYELSSDRSEYIFHVPHEDKVDECDMKVMFRDDQGNPLKCDKVCFRQADNCEYFAMLDPEGDVFFAKDTFKTDSPIAVTIIGGHKDFAPITFTIDEGENEYLLQEKNTRRSSWWIILLQILIVLIVATCLWLLWSPFTEFCKTMFDVIYH